MFDIHTVEIEWGGRPLTLETGKVARQAGGSVIATYGETVVHATVVAAKEPKPGQDFFPLTVNYQEKTYAAGKIPGGYFKREGRPSEKETLVSRLIDRPIRPLFAEGFKCETQVVCTVLQHDLENDPDVVAMVAASAALTLSGVPFLGPIGAARVGYINGEYVLNPNIDEMPESKLDLVVAGTNDAVLMVESEAQQLDEKTMLDAVMFGHRAFQQVINAIIDLAEKAAKEPRAHVVPDHSELLAKMDALVGADIANAYTISDKQARYHALDAAKAKMKETFITAETGASEAQTISEVFKELQAKVVRGSILKTGIRIDGRDTKTVRPIVSEVGVLPRTHGSALFTRGETQALVVATLGTSDDEQYIDSLTGTYKETFLLHYNFPPFSVGETGRMGSPGPPRNRPWQAGLARHPSDAAGRGRLPLHHARRLGDHRVERFVLDGHRLRHFAGADGCRRSAEGAGRGHRDGPHQGRRRLRRVVRHPRRRGSPRRHGFQGRRHVAGRHLAADGHQDHRHHRGDHARRA